MYLNIHYIYTLYIHYIYAIYPHIGGSSDNDKVIKLGPGVKIEQDKDVGAVIVGFDLGINYYKIQYAQLCINKNPGCKFIGEF